MAIGDALKSAEAFLQGLQRSTGAEDVAWSATGGRPDALVMFSRSGESAVLTNEEARQYRRVVDELYEGQTASRKAAVSKKTVEIAVQGAVLSVLRDPHAKDRDRIRDIIQAVRRDLSQPLVNWTVLFAVEGLAAGGRKRRFGPVEFQSATESAIKEVKRAGNCIIDTGLDKPETKKRIAGDFDKHIKERLEGLTIARISTDAVDSESAVRQTRHRLHDTLDVLAFVGSLVVPPSITLSPGIDGIQREGAPVAVFQTDRSCSFASEFKGRPLELDKVFGKDGTRLGAARMSAVLRVEDPSPVQRRLKSAICWAGRAAGQTRPAEAFMSYLIALESLLLGAQRDTELTYRLKVRAAHLLGRNVENRRMIMKRIGELYGVRSAIVHAGVREVADSDLSAAKLYAARALLEVLHSPRINRRGIDLDWWFDDQVLR